MGEGTFSPNPLQAPDRHSIRARSHRMPIPLHAPRPAFRLLRLLAPPCLFASVALGCADTTGTSRVEIVTEESIAALQFGGVIPSLEQVAAAWGRDLVLEEPLRAWRESWQQQRAQGTRARLEAIRAAAPLLSDRMTAGDLEAVLEPFDRAVRGVENLLGESFPPGLLPTLETARDHRDRARAALAADERGDALEHILLGGDVLRSGSVGTLARELLACASRLQRSISGVGPYPEVSDRAERLILGARAALDEGGEVIALRRAWYGFRLLQDTLDTDASVAASTCGPDDPAS
jgi:hypothetical protein